MEFLRIGWSVVLMLLLTTAAFGQSGAQKSVEKPKTQDNPLSAANKFGYGFLKNVMLGSAEKMPEENYKFKPTWVVRSFGQFVGHVAASQYYFCSKVLGEKPPAPNIQQ